MNYYAVKVTRKRIRNAYIRIDKRTGTVKVSVPETMSDKEVERLLKEKEEWIRNKLDSIEKPDRESMSLWGKSYNVNIVCDGSIGFAYSIDEGQSAICIHTSRNITEEECQALIDGILKLETENKLREIVPQWEAITGLKVDIWKVRKMTSRWGSCKPSEKKITISSLLAEYPEECINQVVVHELCHFKVFGHNSDFYKLMDEYYPDWRKVKKILKEFRV